MGLFGKGKPELPMYEQLADTDWISRNRELNSKTWSNLNRDWNNVNVMDDAIRGQLNSVVDDWYNRSKSDFERSYNQTMNKQLARDYNRFGTTGGTSSLLTRDNYNLAKQRELADLASNRSDRYDTLMDNELNRRYKWLNQNYQGWTDSGKTTQANDVANWMIRNGNLDRAYQNDVQSYNNSFGNQVLSLIPSTLGTVGSMFGPIGSAFGYSLGNSIYGGNAQNLLGGVSGGTSNPFSVDDWMNIYGYTGARNGWKGWGSLKESDSSNTTGSTGPLSDRLGYNSNNYPSGLSDNWWQYRY